MKKAIIIVVVIAVVILGGLILLSRSQPQIQQAAQNARVAATDASMKSLTSQLMVMVLQYDQSDKTGKPFIENQNNVSAVNALLAQFKQQRGVDVAYSIRASQNNDVVKIMAQGATNFYCADTVQPTPAVVTVTVSGDNFTSLTDCTGQPLK